MEPKRRITIRDLYPHMTDEELAVAEANLERYVALIVRMHDRLKSEGKMWPAEESADLTVYGSDSTIPSERSIPPARGLKQRTQSR